MEVLYFVERRLNQARIKHLTSLAGKFPEFRVTQNPQDATLWVAQESNCDEVIDFLVKKKKISGNTIAENKKLVDISWFIGCMKEKKLMDIQPSQLLKRKVDADDGPSTKKSRYSGDEAEEHALFRGDANAEARALAFRRGSATLKAHPKEIVCEEDLKNLPYIGLTNSAKAGHCKMVAMEILSEGFSDEVEDVLNGSFYKSMKLFTGIFGIGPQTARKWYHDLGMRTLEDVKGKNISLTYEQSLGMEHYDDLNTPIKLEEAECIIKMVEKACNEVCDELTMTLVGGFRRGKSQGHDLDLLISHPEDGKEKGKLVLIIEKLKEHFIYTGRKMDVSNNLNKGNFASSTMDNFEKCFSIFKFNKSWLNSNLEGKAEWKAVRLDLIVVPSHQFAYALLGWTGTKHFEREIRRYARTEMKIVLTSHGMHSLDTKQNFPAETEEEIFQKLQLEYRAPSERCC
ncbi:unnamed protein product [Clavelina lepadiformis]|uniref:BRCT domain-containing protein n=1 Tax=Clavelina lepadiformis TaxID=159417 RepID=A0ABP0G3M9_CLALP